jgi:glycosyltransferase involved in cell wall biosynthesis
MDSREHTVQKVLLVGGGLGFGGAERRFLLLAQHLFAGSADIAIFKDEHSTSLSTQQRLIHLGWAGRRSYPRMLLRLMRALRSRPYDAVLSFSFHPNMLAWAAAEGLRRRPAMIPTETTRPRTHSTLYFGGCRRAVVHTLERLTYRSADLCAANSADGMREVVQCYGVDPSRIRRIPNLVQPERLAELATAHGSPERSQPPSICVVSRLDPLKRIDTLFEAAAGLSGGLECRIDVVGDGPERAKLETLAANLGIAGRVNFHGWQQNPCPFMARATVVALCSVLEGFSNTVLESMALRIPVVTSFCSSDAEEMCRLGAALGFTAGDHAALRSQLERVLTDEALRRQLADNAWRYAQRHTIPRAIAEYEALVHDAIRWRQQRRPRP